MERVSIPRPLPRFSPHSSYSLPSRPVVSRMIRYLLNAFSDKLNCTVASRRPEATCILLERDTAGFEGIRKTETPAPDWAKITVDGPPKADGPPKEIATIGEHSESNSSIGESREKSNLDENSSIGRSRETSLNSSRAFHEADQKYGERIADDALVTFCDRLKTALASKKSSRTFEGWLGINTILIFARMVAARRELQKAKQKNDKKAVKALESELGGAEEVQKEVEKAITGNDRVVQILYDHSRLHYVVVYSSPNRDELILYDSLLDMDHPKKSLKNISDQIVALFGHLYEGDIPIAIPLNYEQQTDDWSCGYRAIACVLDVVFGRIAHRHSYDLEKIHTLLIDSLDCPEISYDEFSAATVFTQSNQKDDGEWEVTVVRRDSGSREKEDAETKKEEDEAT